MGGDNGRAIRECPAVGQFAHSRYLVFRCCRPLDIPERILKVTKAKAPSRQSDEPIRALIREDFNAAMTLAGAAEGMLKRDGPHMCRTLKEEGLDSSSQSR